MFRGTLPEEDRAETRLENEEEQLASQWENKGTRELEGRGHGQSREGSGQGLNGSLDWTLGGMEECELSRTDRVSALG